MAPRRSARHSTGTGTRHSGRGRSQGGSGAEIPVEGLPIVAVVGRPNVGKSTLFNRVVGQRQAVVEDRARTTRDRLYSGAEWNARRFVVVDTGGLETRPGDPIEERVQEQARLAIAEADVILLVVDAAAGMTPADEEAARILRTAKAPVLVAVNKADNERRELESAEFYRLGWEETYPISALHGRGVADLLDALVWALPPESQAEIERKRAEAAAEEEAQLVAEGWSERDARASTRADGAAPMDEDEDTDEAEDEVDPDAVDGSGADAWADVESELAPPRIAIVGRPNVGKSSLLNALLGEERTIVSDIPGTTRDAIDTSLEWNGIPVRLIDTAGMRRRGKVAGGPAAERFSDLRAIRAIGRADVAVLVIDSVDGLTAQDAHVAGYVIEEGAGLVLALNKWDLVETDEHTFDEYVARIRRESAFLDFAPILAISAKTGRRVDRVLVAALEVAAGRRHRVGTAGLNRVLGEATYRFPPPTVKGRRPRFFYATQAHAEPPTFILFASDAASIHFSYRRYLENQLRDAFGFGGSPLRLILRERTKVHLEPRRRTSAKARAKAASKRRTPKAAARKSRP